MAVWWQSLYGFWKDKKGFILLPGKTVICSSLFAEAYSSTTLRTMGNTDHSIPSTPAFLSHTDLHWMSRRLGAVLHSGFSGRLVPATSNASTGTNPIVITCFRYRVSGCVQGVYFRATTRERAVGLGLSGWVRNTPDGAVEVLACGQDAKLAEVERLAAPRARACTRRFRRARARKARGLPGV